MPALLRVPGNPCSGIGPVDLGGCVMVGGRTRAGDPVDPGGRLTLVLLAEGKKPSRGPCCVDLLASPLNMVMLAPWLVSSQEMGSSAVSFHVNNGREGETDNRLDDLVL